jgi:hypothetical protein
MEYPDKETKPEAYIGQRLLEIQRANIPLPERDWAYKMGKYASCIIEESKFYDFNYAHLYIIDALDYVCDLILKKGENKNEEPILKELVEDSTKVHEKISELVIIIDRIIANTDSLEIKVVSKDIIDHMKDANSSK